MKMSNENYDADIEDAVLPQCLSSVNKRRHSHPSNAFAKLSLADESSSLAERAVPTIHTKQLPVSDDVGRREFYTKCLENIQHSGCKVIGKAWVKLLEEGGTMPWWLMDVDQSDDHGRSLSEEHTK
jgi:hypothetical protein